MTPPADRRSAADMLGRHLLGRQPMPVDDRDYDLADFLDAHRRAQGQLDQSMTVQELLDGGWLSSWSSILAFWKWIKTLIRPPGPKPPTPPSPPSPPPADQDVVWQHGPISDQGQTPHCVGFTGLDWGNCEPVNDGWPNDEGHSIYYACKAKDGEPTAEDGSNSRSLCKVLRDMRRIGRYAFASDLDTIRTYIREHGPVGIGIPWDQSMFTPDADGFVAPDGNEAGGHELMLSGHLPNGKGATTKPSFVMPNHWGSSWADNGVAYITEDDLISLIKRGGDCWAAMEQPLA